MADRSQRPAWLGKDERGWDHVRVHIQLLDDPRVGAYHLAVYMGIVRHAEAITGNAYPSAATLARYTGMSVRKARAVVDELAGWGYLRVEEQPGRSSILVLLAPPELSPPLHLVQPSDGPTPAPPAGDPGTTCRGTPAPPAAELDPYNENQELPASIVVSGSGSIPVVTGTPTPEPMADPAAPIAEIRRSRGWVQTFTEVAP